MKSFQNRDIKLILSVLQNMVNIDNPPYIIQTKDFCFVNPDIQFSCEYCSVELNHCKINSLCVV